MVSAAAKRCAHRANTRWLVLAGALGLLLVGLLGENSIAYAQSGTGPSAARAKANEGIPLLRYRPIPPCGAAGEASCPTPTDLLTQNQCALESDGACDDLLLDLQEWTRWAAWLLGGFTILWILISFFRSSEPLVGHSAEGPWRRIWLRIVEGAMIFLIAWRIGDIASVIEGILWSNQSENVSLSNSVNTAGDTGVVGPPHQAIAQLLGLATAVIVQVFLIYLAPRVVVQVMTGIGMMVSGRLGMGLPPPATYLSIIGSLLQLLAMGVAIFYAPTVLIWIFQSLTG